MSSSKFYLMILENLKKGKNPTQICKENNISKQKLNYYLRGLKEKRLIKKIGYGVWEVKEQVKTSKNLTKDTLEVRGHAFIWKIKIPRKVVTKWLVRLTKFQIPFKMIGLYSKTPRIILDNRKIWLCEKHIIVFENTSFLGKTAIESRKHAVYELLELIKKIEDTLQINLDPYIFAPRREHYALMRNLLAIQCNSKGEPLKIRDLGGLWLTTDDSFNLDELETPGKDAFGNNLMVQPWLNDHKKHKFKVTPTFVLDAINKVTQNQVMFAKNIEEHMQVLKDMRETLKDIRDGIKK